MPRRAKAFGRRDKFIRSSGAYSEALAKNDRNPLSPRETEVLKKLMAGLSNEAISEDLAIDIETVKQHVKHLLRKLHVEDRTQAVLLALRSMPRDQAQVSTPAQRQG